jgi:hypothetical protein
MTPTLDARIATENVLRRFSESAQRTSEIASQVSQRPIILDYNRVASRFYEDQIMQLRTELEKYRGQLNVALPQTEIGSTNFVFSALPGSAVPHEYRRKMNNFVEEADSLPEQL